MRSRQPPWRRVGGTVGRRTCARLAWLCVVAYVSLRRPDGATLAPAADHDCAAARAHDASLLPIALALPHSHKYPCAHNVCGDCVADPECGWCSHTFTCMRGNEDGPTGTVVNNTEVAGVVPCASHQWHFEDMPCDPVCSNDRGTDFLDPNRETIPIDIDIICLNGGQRFWEPTGTAKRMGSSFCECPDGWTGIDCGLCESDAVCGGDDGSGSTARCVQSVIPFTPEAAQGELLTCECDGTSEALCDFFTPEFPGSARVFIEFSKAQQNASLSFYTPAPREIPDQLRSGISFVGDLEQCTVTEAVECPPLGQYNFVGDEVCFVIDCNIADGGVYAPGPSYNNCDQQNGWRSRECISNLGAFTGSTQFYCQYPEGYGDEDADITAVDDFMFRCSFETAGFGPIALRCQTGACADAGAPPSVAALPQATGLSPTAQKALIVMVPALVTIGCAVGLACFVKGRRSETTSRRRASSKATPHDKRGPDTVPYVPAVSVAAGFGSGGSNSILVEHNLDVASAEQKPGGDAAAATAAGAASTPGTTDSDNDRRGGAAPFEGARSLLGAMPGSFVAAPLDAAASAELATLIEMPRPAFQSAPVFALRRIGMQVRVKQRGKRLLRRVLHSASAVIPPSLFAVLGPSGSGKTTLLDIACGRKTPPSRTGPVASIHGEVLLDGNALAPWQRRRVVGYILQDDVLLSTHTVREYLLFQAHLRMSQGSGCLCGGRSARPMGVPAQAAADESASGSRFGADVNGSGRGHGSDHDADASGSGGDDSGAGDGGASAVALDSTVAVRTALSVPATGMEAVTAAGSGSADKGPSGGRASVASTPRPQTASDVNPRIASPSHREQSIRDGISHANAVPGLPERVDELLELFGLAHVAETAIGGEFLRGISGGEKRRLSIAVELLTSPQVLVADEPTSGVDAANSVQVIEALARVARSGASVIMSIHQPRSQIWAMLDGVMVLGSRGHVVYSGSRSGCVPFFESAGFPLPENYNPADFVLDVVTRLSEEAEVALAHRFRDVVASVGAGASAGAGAGAGEAASGAAGSDDGADVPRASADASDNSDTADPTMSSPPANTDDNTPRGTFGRPRRHSHTAVMSESAAVAKAFVGKYYRRRAPWCTQFLELSLRTGLNTWRNPMLLVLNYTVTIGAGVVAGVVFRDLKHDFYGLQDRIGFVLFSFLLFGITSLSSIGVWREERLLFLRERAAGVYTTSPYLSAKLLWDLLPLRIMPPFLFCVIVYWQIGLKDTADAFLWFSVTMALVNMISAALCLAAGALIASTSLANLVASFGLLFSLLLSGMISHNREDEGSLMFGLQKMSFLNYAFELLVAGELSEQTFNLSPRLPGGRTAPSFPATGETVILTFGLSVDSFGIDIGMLFTMFALYVGLLYLVLQFCVKERR